MKKYLMIGFAAVAFASCSNHDIETMSQEQIIKAQYEANFVAQFGQPASNQDWGFGSSTRAFTRGADPRGNMWADLGWNVPPALTNDQKELVRQYFQQNQAKKYEDPQLTNYWVQQVYKGGTKCKNNGDDNSKTTEKYQSANNGWVVGSDHMDHLEAVLPNGTHEHINDFNNGNCTDFEGTMLMVQSGTKEFGYFNSDGSLGHTNYTSLVSWRTIAEWAVEKSLATSVEACVLNDEWNRSFMGFDFEQVVGEDIYDKNGTSIHYLTYGDLPGKSYIWDGTTASEKPSWDTQVLYNGQPIPVLTDNTNMYCGDNGDINQSDLITRQMVQKGTQWDGNKQEYVPYYQEEECIDMTVIYGKLAAEYLPVKSSGEKWVKVHGGADGYYSDWIVTLTEAKNSNTDITYQGRIMAEDLSAQYDPTGKTSDWDFNDVVFDWAIKDGKAYIKLLAAGGTLPIRIGGTRNDNSSEPSGSVEIHNNVNGLGGYMKNCGVGDEVPAKELVLDDHTYTDAKNILITVYKGGSWVEIQAEQGEPAAKFNCKVGTKWCDEYVNITRVYRNFTAWVANPSVDWTQGDGSTSVLTDGDLTNNQ